ncbi:hypothetical protein GCM10027403_12520 [Arthrobacter tecti]
MTDETGATVGAGELVVLYGWPSSDILSAMQVEESVKLLPVAKAYTRTDGSFDLRVEDPAVVEPIASSTDQVDFEISSDQAEASYVYHFDRTLSQTSTGSFVLTGTTNSGSGYDTGGGGGHTLPVEPTPTPLRAGTTSSQTQTDEGATAEPATETVHVKLAPMSTGKTRDTESTGASAVADFKNKACYSKKLVTYSPTWVTVGQSFVNTTNVISDFQYSHGATSSLGIAVSASGKAGSYSSGGTNSITSSATIDFPQQGSNTAKRFESSFVYAKFQSYCHTVQRGNYNFKYTIKPIAFAGGSRVVNQPFPSANYCRPHASGTKFTKETSSSITWSNGVTLGSTVGVQLSSQTGYTGKARAFFDFRSSRQLCGSHGYPADTPRFLVAKG